MSATSLAFALIHPELASFGKPITVFNPGGMVRTILHHENHHYWIELIGNATFTHRITVPEDSLHNATVTDQNSKVVPTGEREDYLKFINDLDKPEF